MEKTYRPEIDGLRAIAVLSVLLFHVELPQFSGGYVGVDVFFVISGYLITRNIYAGLLAGTFSFPRFYLARLRRLYPALLATVALTLLFGALLFTPAHLAGLAPSAIASLLGYSNIHFWMEVGYWDPETSLKPLLHIWSLSLEEQFYLVWPLLLVLASRLKHRRIAVIVTVAGIGAASFYYAGEFHPKTAFYWMPLRAFEFAIGAVMIWIEQARSRWLAEIAAAAGLGLVGFAVVTFTKATPFPYAGALYPCIGAALMIYAGPSIVARLWNNPLGIAIGRISYSLYLVHWPVVIFYSYWKIVAISALQNVERFGLIVMCFALALPLYFLTERRFRYADTRGNLAFLSSAAATTSLVLLVAGSAWRSDGWPWRHAPFPALDSALITKRWPLCDGGNGLCAAPQKIVLIGDSHGIHIQRAIAQILKREGLTGAVYPLVTNCFFLRDYFPVNLLSDIRGNKCGAAEKEWRARIEAENPAIVILAGFWIGGIDPSISGLLVRSDSAAMPTHAESRTLFKQKMTETVAWLTSHGIAVVIVGTSPMVEQPPSICYQRPNFLGNPDCAKVNVLSKPEVHAETTAFMKSLAGDDVLYIDLMAALCQGNVCPLGENGISFYYDRHHLNTFGELWLADHAFGPVADFLKKSVSKDASVKSGE